MNAVKRAIRLLARRPQTEKSDTLEAVRVAEQANADEIATADQERTVSAIKESIHDLRAELTQGVMKFERRAAEVREELAGAALVLITKGHTNDGTPYS